MAVFESTEHIEASAEHVHAWHGRPGALTRLSPEWAQQVISEAYPPLSPGARAHLRTSVPGTSGTVRVPFVSEHDAGPAPRSFVDRMVKGPMASWVHTHVFEEEPGTSARMPWTANTCRVLDRVEYEFLPPGLRGAQRYTSAFTDRAVHTTLVKTFAARTQRLRADLGVQAELDRLTNGRRMKILIAGASGLVGSQVAALFSTGGHDVRTLVRREPERADQVRWNPTTGDLDPADVAWADVVIHLGGKSIATRFTDSAKQQIMDSRVGSTRLIVDTCAGLPAEDRPQAFVCASAVGAYGADRGDESLAEDAAYGEGFLAEVCKRWEAEAARVEDLGMRRVSVRTGVVLTSLGGVLKLQLPLYLTGLGGPLGDGRQWFAWISLDDITDIYARAAVDTTLNGPVNAVAPEQVRQKDFARALARTLHRPTVVPVPRFGPKLLLGEDGARELAMANQRAVPAVLQHAGHTFRHPTLEDTFATTLPL